MPLLASRATLTTTLQLSFPQAPSLVTEIPGPMSKKAFEQQGRFETRSRVYSNALPIAIAQGKGSTVRDLDGNVYIDWFAGICVQNLGHAHPAVVEAIRKQMDVIVHCIDLPHGARLEFV